MTRCPRCGEVEMFRDDGVCGRCYGTFEEAIDDYCNEADDGRADRDEPAPVGSRGESGPARVGAVRPEADGPTLERV